MRESKSSNGARALTMVAALLFMVLASWMFGCGGSTSTTTSTGGGTATAGTVSGRVIDTSSNDEVQGAMVTIAGQSCPSDWVGHYEIHDVPAGQSSVSVSCQGYLAYTGNVSVAAQATTTLDLLISPPSRVEGTISDGATHNPVPASAVTLGTTASSSNDLGHYTLSQVPAGTQTVSATKPGYVTGWAMVNIPKDETVTQDFTLYPPGSTGTVQGTVLEAISGITLAGVQVTVQGAQVTTDARGNFTLNGTPAGTHILMATLAGYNTYQGTLDVGDKATLTYNFDMAQPGTTGTVEGQVLDMNTGAQLGGVALTIGSKKTVTSKSGKFSIASVPVGNPVITLSKAGYITHADTVLVEPDTLDQKYLALASKPLRKGPYLRYNNDTHSMTVLWQTFNSPSLATIEWGETPAYGHTATVTENSGAMNEHQFSHTIAGLAEETRVHYKVTVDGQSATGSFRTAPKPSATTLSFYAYGDTRASHALWTPSNDHEMVCKGIVDDMKGKSSRQTLLLHDGDIVRHGLDEAYWDTQYFMRCYPYALELQSTLPILAALGNHECYLSNCSGVDYQQGGKLLRKYWQYLMYPRGDRFYYSFDYGPVHFAVVDTWMHPDYKPGTDQYDWLAKDLDQSTRPWKVVYMHTPPWDCNIVDSGLVSGLTPLFKQKGVKLVLAGHVHHYSRCIVDGIQYLALGGGGAPLDAIANPYNPVSAAYVQKAVSKFHFGRFEVSSQSIKIAILEPDGKLIESFEVTK